MKALILWTLRMRRWYITWWSIGSTLFVGLELGLYPSFKNQTAALNQSLSQLPPAVKSLIGDNGNYFSPENYLNSRVFYLVLPIVFAILLIGLGSSLLAKDEDDGTLELLLARPISRAKVLFGKAISGLLISGIIALVTLFFIVVLSKAVGLPNSPTQISAAMLLSYLMCLVFGAFAFMLTALGKAGRALSIGLTTAVFLTSYIITGLATSIEWLRWPAKLLPYYYFNPQKMLTGDYAWWPVFSFSLAIAVFAIIAYLGFRRRDIG